MENEDTWNVTECYETCKDGFLRVGDCYGGLPIIMSAPHYFNVDPVIHDQVVGLDPRPDLHDTFIDIEKMTGVPLSAHKRIQVRFQMAL